MLQFLKPLSHVKVSIKDNKMYTVYCQHLYFINLNNFNFHNMSQHYSPVVEHLMKLLKLSE